MTRNPMPLRDRVVGALRLTPMTVDELMRRLPRRESARGRGWDPNRIRPACSELARQGLTYKLMERGRSDAGFPCAIWAAVPKEEDK